MAISEKKKEQLLREIAKELKAKYELELYRECLDIGSRIYDLTKNIE